MKGDNLFVRHCQAFKLQIYIPRIFSIRKKVTPKIIEMHAMKKPVKNKILYSLLINFGTLIFMFSLQLGKYFSITNLLNKISKIPIKNNPIAGIGDKRKKPNTIPSRSFMSSSERI